MNRQWLRRVTRGDEEKIKHGICAEASSCIESSLAEGGGCCCCSAKDAAPVALAFHVLASCRQRFVSNNGAAVPPGYTVLLRRGERLAPTSGHEVRGRDKAWAFQVGGCMNLISSGQTAGLRALPVGPPRPERSVAASVRWQRQRDSEARADGRQDKHSGVGEWVRRIGRGHRGDLRYGRARLRRRDAPLPPSAARPPVATGAPRRSTRPPGTVVGLLLAAPTGALTFPDPCAPALRNLFSTGPRRGTTTVERPPLPCAAGRPRWRHREALSPSPHCAARRRRDAPLAGAFVRQGQK